MASPKLLETFASAVGDDVDEPPQADLPAGVRLRAAEHMERSLTSTAALPHVPPRAARFYRSFRKSMLRRTIPGGVPSNSVA